MILRNWVSLFLLLMSCAAPEIQPTPNPPLPDKVGHVREGAAVQYRTMESFGFSESLVHAQTPRLSVIHSDTLCPDTIHLKFSSINDLISRLHGQDCLGSTKSESNENGVGRWLIAECQDSLEMLLVIFPEEHPGNSATAVVGYLDSVSSKKCLWDTTLRVGFPPIVSDDDAMRIRMR